MIVQLYVDEFRLLFGVFQSDGIRFVDTRADCSVVFGLLVATPYAPRQERLAATVD